MQGAAGSRYCWLLVFCVCGLNLMFAAQLSKRMAGAFAPGLRGIHSGVAARQMVREPHAGKMSHQVFVYCTFQDGGAHDYMLDNAVSKSAAKTKDLYPMVVSEGLPYLLDFKGYGNQIKGTLYTVCTSTLKSLDRELCSISPSYHKTLIPVQAEDGTTTHAIAYVRQHFPGEFLKYEWQAEFRPNWMQGQPFFSQAFANCLAHSPEANDADHDPQFSMAFRFN